jgi:hypothetical protein
MRRTCALHEIAPCWRAWHALCCTGGVEACRSTIIRDAAAIDGLSSGFLLPSSPPPPLPSCRRRTSPRRRHVPPCRITRRLRRLRSAGSTTQERRARRPISPPADAGMLPCARSVANSSGCPPRLGGPATAATARSRRSAVPEAPIRRRTQGQYVPLGRARRARRMALAD